MAKCPLCNQESRGVVWIILFTWELSNFFVVVAPCLEFMWDAKNNFLFTHSHRCIQILWTKLKYFIFQHMVKWTIQPPLRQVYWLKESIGSAKLGAMCLYYLLLSFSIQVHNVKFSPYNGLWLQCLILCLNARISNVSAYKGPETKYFRLCGP